MPSDLVLKSMNTAHRTMLKLSGGRLGWSAYDMPVLELTTTGRRSGRSRTVMLTSPVQEGDSLAVVASRGGDDTHPAWFLNLRDDPEVEVVLEGRAAQSYRAEIVDDDERARLWTKITADHRNYATYQDRTDREIPVVLLHPET